MKIGLLDLFRQKELYILDVFVMIQKVSLVEDDMGIQCLMFKADFSKTTLSVCFMRVCLLSEETIASDQLLLSCTACGRDPFCSRWRKLVNCNNLLRLFGILITKMYFLQTAVRHVTEGKVQCQRFVTLWQMTVFHVEMDLHWLLKELSIKPCCQRMATGTTRPPL